MTYLGFVNRYHCPLPGCGWAHDVDLGAEPSPPIVVPVADFDPVAFRVTDSRVLADAISTATERQFRELMERTETVIREHLEGHDFVEVVLALTAAQQAMERVRAELETMTHVAKVNGEGHRAAYQGGEEARQAVARVRALHQPLERAGSTCCAHCSGWDGKFRCRGLVTPWPCPTIAGLDGTPEA